MGDTSMGVIKYPRAMVSNQRHAKLAKEARANFNAGRPGGTIQELAEIKFKIADKHKDD